MYRQIGLKCQKIPKNQKSLLKIGLDESAGCEIVSVTEDGAKPNLAKAEIERV